MRIFWWEDFRRKVFLIDKKKAIEESKKLLARSGTGYIDPTMDVSEISQCEAQLVEIAKTLGFNPSIIVMDEPTSALSSDEVERLYKIIRQLKAEGLQWFIFPTPGRDL